MTEKLIESNILDFLNSLPGIFAIKINTVGVYDAAKQVFRKNKNPHVHRGTSDILMCARGIFAVIEVKKPEAHKTIRNKAAKGLPQEELVERQFAFIDRVKAAGGMGIMVSSLKEVEDFLKTF